MTVGEVERGEALLVIAALLRDMDLREGKACDRSDAQSGKDERISGGELCIAIRDDLLGAAGKKDGERFRGVVKPCAFSTVSSASLISFGAVLPADSTACLITTNAS